MRLIKYVFWNLVFTVLMVCGWALNIEEFRNVTYLLVALYVVFAIANSSERGIQEARDLGNWPSQTTIGLVVLARMLFWAWFGAWLVLLAYMVGACINANTRAKAFSAPQSSEVA